jgi:hypothetical protein
MNLCPQPLSRVLTTAHTACVQMVYLSKQGAYPVPGSRAELLLSDLGLVSLGAGDYPYVYLPLLLTLCVAAFQVRYDVHPSRRELRYAWLPPREGR